MSLSVFSPLTLLTTALISVVPTYGHGRLQVPMTRLNAMAGYDAYENDPVNFQTQFMATTYKRFSCRNDPPKDSDGNLEDPPTTVYAGDVMDVQWTTSADHVGDCALYVSYDYDYEGDEIADMEWFKIANWKDCKSREDEPNEINVPVWLPAGRAVFRWDWYALHVHPTIEFYAQCADVEIIGGVDSLQVSQVPKYSMMGLYPEEDGMSDWAQGWRNPHANPVPSWMTGPPCACKSDTSNNCTYTDSEETTPGYIPRMTIPESIYDCGTSSTPAPVASGSPTTSPTPSPTVEGQTWSPTATPTPAPTAAVGDCVGAWGKCGGSGWTGLTCCVSGYYCVAQSEWYSQCTDVPPGSTPAPTITTAPTPTDVTDPSSEPTLAPTLSPVATTISQTLSPTSPPTDSDGSSGCIAVWGKCGGSGYNGPTCCESGNYCKYQDEWYSQCTPGTGSDPTNTASPTPSPTNSDGTAGPTPSPTTASPTTTRPTASPVTPAPTTEGDFNPSLNIIGYYGNSGGQGCPNGSCIPHVIDIPEEYNVVVFNFINFDADSNIEFLIGGPDQNDIADQVDAWKAIADPWGRHKHALISLGGQNGNWPSGLSAAVLEDKMIDFMDEYNLDGLDVDLEGAALAGGDTVGEVLVGLKDAGYVLAAAPEAAQGPLNAYANVIPHLTYLHPQFYNNGPNAVAGTYLPTELTWPWSYPATWEEPIDGDQSCCTDQPWWLTILERVGELRGLSYSQLGMLVPATTLAAGNNNVWDYDLLAEDIKKHNIGHVGTWAIGHDATEDYQFAKAMGDILGPKN